MSVPIDEGYNAGWWDLVALMIKEAELVDRAAFKGPVA
jgi:hypothetical protein